MARRLLAPLTYLIAACALVPAVPLGALAPCVLPATLPLPGAVLLADLCLGLAGSVALAVTLAVDSWTGGAR